jgi:hypothetical protein
VSQSKTQFVYLIASSDSSLVKIGTAQDVAARLRTLQNSSPTPLQVLWQTEGGRRLEAGLHEQFAEYRQHGEWFNLQGLDAVGMVSAAADQLAANVAVRDARKRPAYLRSDIEDDGALGSMMAVLVWESSIADPQERLLMLALADQGGARRVWMRHADLHRKTQIPLGELDAVLARLVEKNLVRPTSEPHPAGLPLPGYWINVALLRSMRAFQA